MLDVQVDREQVRKVQKTFRALPRDLKNDIRKVQRASLNPIWREEMAASKGTPMHSVIFRSGNRTKAGAPMMLVAGAANRRLSGGATTGELAKAYEFGSTTRNNYTKYRRRSTKGKTHTVTRRTRKQLPSFRRGGWIAYPAAARAIPRLTSLHVQTLMRRIYLAAEGRTS